MIARRCQKYIDPQLWRPNYSRRVAYHYFGQHGHQFWLAQVHQYPLAEPGDFPNAAIPIAFVVSTAHLRDLVPAARLVLVSPLDPRLQDVKLAARLVLALPLDSRLQELKLAARLVLVSPLVLALPLDPRLQELKLAVRLVLER